MHGLGRGDTLSLWVGEVAYNHQCCTDLSVVSHLGFWLAGKISAIMGLFHKFASCFFFLYLPFYVKLVDIMPHFFTKYIQYPVPNHKYPFPSLLAILTRQLCYYLFQRVFSPEQISHEHAHDSS